MPEEDATPQPDQAVQAMEEKWLRAWEEWGIYRFDPHSPKPLFSIDTPPPTVSGRMHIGHAYSYNQMDFVARYKRMRGYHLFYPFGFDDNGLPTERYTEKAVGKKLSDVGRQEFIRLCLHETKKGEADMEKSWRRIGTSCDWTLVYRTIDKPVVKISQESFLDLHKRGLSYRAERPSIWCPDCQTAIAQVETEDRLLPSTFNDIAFDLVGGVTASGEHLRKRETKDGRDVWSYHQGAEGKLVISTTRPELIPACVAIFVHPDDPRTRHLIGMDARVPIGGAIVPVLTSEKVDKETGTGVVMCCTFGDQTDVDWWAQHKLPLRVVIGKNGLTTDAAGKYAAQSVAHARQNVLQDLDREGRLLHQKHFEHHVNVHERCGTPVEFLITKQWFVKYLDDREKFLERGHEVSWHPEYMRVRYDNWVKGLKWDWCISRQRYFGVPFPVWYCTSCQTEKLAHEDELPVDPTVDQPKHGKCAHCGGTEFRGETDVMDTWATSSLTPQIAILAAAERMGVQNAKLRDIDTNPKLAALLPMSVRSQAHEIISFWAFNTIVKAHDHHAKIPWKDTMISGFVKLGKGKKMSKSKGDIVEPLQVIQDYSGDALRYWSATGANLGEDIIWNPKDLTRAQRLVTKLKNVEAFIGRAVGESKPAPVAWDQLALADQWILAEFAQLTKDVTEAWDGYEYARAVKDTENFLWHTLADHYLELVKARLYEGDAGAKHALYTVGLGVLKLLAPILCFVTEDVYQETFAKHEGARSVHVSDWPTPAQSLDASAAQALAGGAIVRDVVAAVRGWKAQNKLALNAALPPLEVVAPAEARAALMRAKKDIVGTTRVEDVRFVEASDVQMRPTSVVPVQAIIGPRHRQHAKTIAEAVKQLDPTKVEPQNVVVTLPDGSGVRLQPDEFEVKMSPTLHGAAVDAMEIAGVTILLRKPA